MTKITNKTTDTTNSRSFQIVLKGPDGKEETLGFLSLSKYLPEEFSNNVTQEQIKAICSDPEVTIKEYIKASKPSETAFSKFTS